MWLDLFTPTQASVADKLAEYLADSAVMVKAPLQSEGADLGDVLLTEAQLAMARRFRGRLDREQAEEVVAYAVAKVVAEVILERSESVLRDDELDVTRALQRRVLPQMRRPDLADLAPFDLEKAVQAELDFAGDRDISLRVSLESLTARGRDRVTARVRTSAVIEARAAAAVQRLRNNRELSAVAEWPQNETGVEQTVAPSAPRPSKRERTRDLLCKTALMLMAETDWRSLTVEQVAVEAGLVPKTVYNHFLTKSDLLVEASLEAVNAELRNFRASLQRPTTAFRSDPDGSITEYVDEVLYLAAETVWRSTRHIVILRANLPLLIPSAQEEPGVRAVLAEESATRLEVGTRVEAKLGNALIQGIARATRVSVSNSARQAVRGVGALIWEMVTTLYVEDRVLVDRNQPSLSESADALQAQLRRISAPMALALAPLLSAASSPQQRS